MSSIDKYIGKAIKAGAERQAKKDYKEYIEDFTDISKTIEYGNYDADKIIDRVRKNRAKVSGLLRTIKNNKSVFADANGAADTVNKINAYYASDSVRDNLYKRKYTNYSVADVDNILKTSTVVPDEDTQSEYDWLNKNRDSFMSTDDILSEIASLEEKSAELKKDKFVDALSFIAGGFSGDKSYHQDAFGAMTDSKNAVTENQARLKKLYELAASREDFDAETAYKEADEHNIFDVLKPDYSMADYRNDQSKKNAYGAAVIKNRDSENMALINADDELRADLEKYFSLKSGSSVGGNVMGGNIITSEIANKYKNTDVDFDALYETFSRYKNAENTENLNSKINKFTEKAPVLLNATSVVTNVFGGAPALAESAYTKVKDLLSDDVVSLDVNSPGWALKNATDEIIDTTSSMIAKNNDGIKGEFYNFLYQTGMSMADMGASFVASGFNPTVYPIIMSSNAAADKIKTVTESGGSIDEALLSGLMAGAFEAVFEKVGIDKLVETVTSSAGKSVFKTFLNGFLSEGLEELGTDIANSVSDALINGDNSELNNSIYKYMQDGYSANEANAMALTDLAKQYMTSFAGGALSGGIIGGVGGGINSAIINRENTRLGKETIAEGSTDYLLELAKAQSAAQNEDVQKATSRIDKYQERQAEKLYKSTGKTEINNAVKDRLRVLGMEKGEIDSAAQEITDTYFKKNSKLKKFAENKTALRVLFELGSTSQTEAQYTNEWASNAKNSLQEKISDETRNKYRAKDIGSVRRAVLAVTPEYEMQHQTFRTEANMTEKQKKLGAALTADTNKSVTVSRVLEKAEGGMVVQLTNGQKGFVATEINAKSDLPQIKMKNTESNHLMTVASVYETPQTVNAFINAINENQDVIEYSKEFKTAYDMGIQNADLIESDFKVITKEQARLAYQSGMQDASISYVTAINDTKALFEKVKNESFSAGVTRLDNSKNNNSYRIKTQLKVLNAYGKKHNLSFIIADSIETEQGSANGVYLGENKIVISTKAEAGAILSVAGHEVYHYLEVNNKKGAAALREWVLDYLSKSKDFDLEARRAEIKKRYGTEADVDAEIVANSMFDVLSNEKAINSLGEENPSLLRNILKRIKAFIDDIKAVIAQLGEQWAEVKALSKDLQALESIRWLMESALSQIKTTSQTEKNTAQKDGEVKYSLQITQDDIRTLQTIGRKSINEFTSDEIHIAEKWAKKFWNELGTKSPFFRAWFGDWRINDTSPVKVVKITNNEYSEKRRLVENNDLSSTGNKVSIIVDENVIKDSLHYAQINGDLNATRKLLAHIDEIIQESIHLDTQVSHKNKGNKKGTTTFMHYLYCPVEYNGAPFVAKITVEEYDVGGKRRAYNAQRIKMSSLPRAHFSQLNNEAKTRKIRLQDDEIMISDLFSLVKQHDKNFKPNPASEIVNEDGTPKVVYHGSYSNFTIFDKNARKHSKSPKGTHFFTDSEAVGYSYTGYKEQAKPGESSYSGGLYPVYLNIRKPYIIDFKGQVWSEKIAGMDINEHAEYAMNNGYDGVVAKNIIDDGGYGDKNWNEDAPRKELATDYIVFDSNQIKSATDNVGTFDKDNPDIRYSFAGGNALTAKKSLLAEAMELEKNGVDSEEIRQSTGWFRGYDNKWRFEIDDSKSELIENPKLEKIEDAFVTYFTGTLEDILKHDDLYSAYPLLKNINIVIQPTEIGVEGIFQPKSNYITLSIELFKRHTKEYSFYLNNRAEEAKKIEQTDAYKEFNKLYEDDYAESMDAETWLEEEKKAREKFYSSELGKRYYQLKWGKYDKQKFEFGWTKQAKEVLMHELQHAVQNIEGFSQGADIRNPNYDRIAGEIEARDTARRVNFDADRRKNTRPDIDREDVVFADSASGENRSDDIKYSLKSVDKKQQKEYNDIRKNRKRASYNENETLFMQWQHGKSASVGDTRAFIRLDKKLHFYEKTEDGCIEITKKDYEQLRNEYESINEKANRRFNGLLAPGGSTERGSNKSVDVYGYSGDDSRNDSSVERSGFQNNQQGNLERSRGDSEETSEIKLSLQSTDAARQTREKLIKQNKNMQVANMILKQELIQTHGKMLTYDGAKALAKEMKINFSSSYDANVLAEEIYDAFKWYDRTDMSTEQLLDYFTRVGEKVVAKSVGLERTLYDDYADARKWIREMEFTLPEHVLKQLNENHSGKFVLHTFGKMRYVSKETHPDAPYLSAIYSELASEYPNFFSEEDNEYEQPQKLLDFWQKIKPTYYNPLAEMGFDSPEKAAVSFAYILFNKYLNSEKLVTFADKKREYSRNLERALVVERAYYKKRLINQKEYYIDSRNKSSEERKKTLVKKKIQNVIKELDKYLNRGSKDKNVKLDMQETVTAALSSAEILFSETLNNADLVRAGIENSPVLSSADDIEKKWLAEYAELLDKRDGYLRQLDIVNNQSLSEESLSARDGVEKMIRTADKKLKELDKQLEGLFEREKRRIDNTSVDEALSKLAGAYKSIEDSEYSYISNSYDENVYNHIEFIRKELKGAKISLMNINQLDSVYEAYKMVLHTVRNANKIFAEGKQADVEALANDVMSEIKKVGGYRDRRATVLKAIDKFGWNELKPVYAFRSIGSDTLTERYEAMRKGEDSYYNDVADAKGYASITKKKYNFGSWDLKKTYSFESKSGKEFTLTLEEIMSLYAYSRRGDQAVEHITRGGIVHSKNIKEKRDVKNGKLLSYDMENATAYSITVDTFGEIVATLTNNQKKYVEEMQKYLSDVMGEKGNEVSMKMYGVKLFKEKIYFPLKSSTYYRAYDGKQEGEVLLKNSGFTNATVPHANNPIVIDDFSNVWSNHVHDMSMYHSFVLPVEDFMRIYNYQTRITEDSTDVYSVKATLQGAYGDGATEYIKTFIRDVNGGVQVQGGTELVNKLTSLSKKSAVFASLSVVIQQPSAVLRAVAYVNPKYFLNALPKSVNWVKVNKEYEELKKYAPVAGIKQMGYFDTGLGRSTADWIMADEYNSFGQKITGFLKDGSYRDEVFAWLPGKADEISWVYIWNAIKQEIAASGKYSVGSQEYLNACGDRFTEVIELTQVYDSVFSRSGFMRNKDSLMKMVTSFMAEPTVQINMLLDAGIQGKRGDKKHIASVIGAVYASILANAMLKSIVTAGRDDDEDLNYGEKYIGNLVGSFLQDGLMLSSIPFVRDIISLVQGYDVERMDMSVISNIISSFSSLFSENKTTWDKISGVAGSVASLVGIPLKNITRDIEALVNTFKTATKDYKFSNRAAAEAIIRNITNKSTAKGDLLYFATVNGDSEYANRLKELYESETSLNSAIRTALREHDDRITKAAQARIDGNIAEYMHIAKEIVAEKRFSQDNVVMAISAQVESLGAGDDSKNSSKRAKGYFTDDDYLVSIICGDDSTAKAVADDIIKTDIANGKSEDDAQEQLITDLRSNLKEAYEVGDVSAEKAVDVLTDYCDMTVEEAKNKVSYWAFKSDYADISLSEEAFIKYESMVKPSGMDIKVFAEFYEKQSECTSDKDENGNSISGSKKKKILDIINSLNISSKQKDALYYCSGYKESSIDEAPWH